MASNRELVQLFDQGELGKFLAQTFKGERGHVYKREDSNFLIIFPSEELTPKIESLKTSVTTFFENKGYGLEFTHSGLNSFTALASYDSGVDGCVVVVITTKYPFPTPGQGRASLRVTTTNCF